MKAIDIQFTHSKFRVYTPQSLNTQPKLSAAFEVFFKQKAIDKISPRVLKWSKSTGLAFNELKFMQLEKRWGSCTPNNNIIINTEAIKLPYSLIDYLVVHELVHTQIKNHSKAFWAALAVHLPNWKKLDGQINVFKL